MGFFSAFKASSAYERTLKGYGVEPNSLPPKLNAAICSYSEQQFKHIKQFMGKSWTPDFNLESQLELSASLVAVCVLGPSNFPDDSVAYSTVKQIQRAAKDTQKKGPNCSKDTKIIDALKNAGLLHSEVVMIFNEASK